MFTAENIANYVEDSAGTRVVGSRSLSAGHNTALYLVDLDNGTRLVAKLAPHGDARLDVEGWMLSYLGRVSALPVPDVIKCDPHILLMSYIPCSGVIDEDAQTHAAELLTKLHSIKAPVYGLERDTVIGPLLQPNQKERDWIAFFRDHRLLYMARKALEEGQIGKGLMRRIETLAADLDQYIGTPAAPSLIHGDIWSGNVLSLKGKISGFIDPAVYYADPEIELAFSTLFGTFSEPFFQRYNELSPIRDGFFEVRKDIYNLYPLLVHVRIYGLGYVQAVTRILDRLVA